MSSARSMGRLGKLEARRARADDKSAPPMLRDAVVGRVERVVLDVVLELFAQGLDEGQEVSASLTLLQACDVFDDERFGFDEVECAEHRGETVAGILVAQT